MKSKRQHNKKSERRQRTVYSAPSGKEYTAHVIQVDHTDNSVRIEMEYTPGKWMQTWVSLNDVSAVRQ